MSGTNELMLIDGHALIYRAFHALPPLSTTRGELTNAVFGFTSMVLKALQDLQPEYVACTFDRPKPTFRHEEYKEYKAQRPPMPSELSGQLARVREVVDVLRLPVFELDGYEADDLIGTLSKQAAAKKVLTTIVTGDLDTLQLVGELVRVYAPRGRMSDIVVYDVEKVYERFKVSPPQTVDIKALKGDPSDNIPGVPGFGEKTASDIVARFGSIEEILARLGELKGKQREQLEQYREQVLFGKRLATIVDAPIELDLQACRRQDYSRAEAVDLFRELEFNSLVPRLPRGSLDTSAPGPAELEGPLYGSAPLARQVSMFDDQVESSRGERQPGPAPEGETWPRPLPEEQARPSEPEVIGACRVARTEEQIDALAHELRTAGCFSMRAVAHGNRAMEARVLGLAVAYDGALP
ncbi:MAG: 5'-3' exonuclease, partial [Chloroflexota bacterium]